MARRRDRRERVKVPNPARVPKGRLDAPAGRVHEPKTRHRRRPKHPKRERESLDE